MNIKLLVLGYLIGLCKGENCVKKSFGYSSFVCVCNSTVCDKVTPEWDLKPHQFLVYMSSRDEYRLDNFEGYFNISPGPYPGVNFNVNPLKTYQTIIGFGGAFTDATGINVMSLPEGAQEKWLKSYFSSEGIQYSIGRIPMASCDFSTYPYSYDNTSGDFEMTKFSLQYEDMHYKIPLMTQAVKMLKEDGRNILFFGSPWSAPAWMKTNDDMTGYGTLKGPQGGPYYKAWAEYFVHFIREYQSRGIEVWGVTAQNEPSDGYIHGFPFQAMGWTPEQQRDFIANDLGPALEENGFGDVKIMILDDQRIFLPYWADKVLSNSTAAKYVSGIAIHWYEDPLVPVLALDSTHDMFPDKFIFGTEACIEPIVDKRDTVALGDWSRAERYAKDILQDLQHWVTGWTDWNMALDMQGGPNWVSNFVDSPVIVNKEKGEFYKQPMFYAMGHFSKFVPPGSVRVAMEAVSGEEKDLSCVTFLREKQTFTIVCANFGDENIDVSFKVDDVQGYLFYSLPPHSLATFRCNYIP
ncbi:hypothetical protein ACJMK2_020059 [Sinanodonta woodiana]|uniref:Glucosylceramidase n=1 Tax=Sinanodonta woodiana TaxID=1069815 RepID=A0ABD3U181_SINWO